MNSGTVTETFSHKKAFSLFKPLIMSSVVSRSSSSGSSSSGKSDTTKKRKSNEGVVFDNDENAKPSNNANAATYAQVTSAKKQRPTASLESPRRPAKKGSGIARAKSALPRFSTRQRPSALVSGDDNIRSTPAKQTTFAEPLPKGTPSTTKISQSAFTPSRNELVEKLRKRVIEVPLRNSLQMAFENAFTVDQERVSSITNMLKTKSKWDFKEKEKRQTMVIKELRESVLTLLTEIQNLRSTCISSESDVDQLLREAHTELRETLRGRHLLRESEDKLRIENGELRTELLTAKTSSRNLTEEIIPLREREKELASKVTELTDKLRAEEMQRMKSETVLSGIENELRFVKESSAESLASLREQYDQRIETSKELHKEELSNLRRELGQRQSIMESSAAEKARIDQEIASLREDLSRSQSSLRDAETGALHHEKEVQRMSAEAEKLADQLSQKDTDLRQAMNSLQEIQRTALEEKNSLRNELSSLQMKLQTLEAERLSMTSELATKREENASSSRELMQLRETVSSLEARLEVKDGMLAEYKESAMQLEVERGLRQRCEMREEAERSERVAACAQLLATQQEGLRKIKEVEEAQQAEKDALRAEVSSMTSLRDEAMQGARAQDEVVMGLQSEVNQLRQALDDASQSVQTEAVEKLGRMTGELEVLKKRLQEATELKNMEESAAARRITELEQELQTGESQRRKMHNLIQELRGNVRVFARLRPFLPNDGFAPEDIPESAIQVHPDGSSLRVSKAASEDGRGEDYAFNFDRVFGPSCSQESIFTEVSEFVQSALDGYNVCLFSYGQTGSGKTHTMQGLGNGPMRGIIPRAMEQVGLYKRELEGKGWEYAMQVSFVEIYNESIRDLLRTTTNSELKHDIKRDPNGCTMVTDVVMQGVDPNDSDQIDAIMMTAARHRSVATTNMNERSSRSHSVFTLHLKAKNPSQGIVLHGALSLVDLAGSERLDRSGATGERLKETVAINKSLSSLTDVFTAIANKQPHVPYRNSKLTYLLQPALSGDGKTLMLVNLSPTDESFHESLCSLRFAKQVNQCELGKPKRQMKDVGISDDVSVGSSSGTGAGAPPSSPKASKKSRGQPGYMASKSSLSSRPGMKSTR